MIDEEKTFERFGYRSTDLSHASNRDIVAICEWCDELYVRCRNGADDARFCSHNCYWGWMKGKNCGPENPHWKGGLAVCICEVCGDEYEIPRSQMHRTKCCSVKCRILYAARSISGDKSYMWNGGSSFVPYCSKFSKSFKETIREKYGRICFICGKNEDCNGRKLDVHHVNYRKDCLCDGIECEFVPLCRVCHPRTNTNRLFWQKLFTYSLQYHDDYYSIDIRKPLLLLKV